MIPWFVVNFVRAAARPFGLQTVAVATIGRFGVDRISFVREGRFASATLSGVRSAQTDGGSAF